MALNTHSKDWLFVRHLKALLWKNFKLLFSGDKWVVVRYFAGLTVFPLMYALLHWWIFGPAAMTPGLTTDTWYVTLGGSRVPEFRLPLTNKAGMDLLTSWQMAVAETKDGAKNEETLPYMTLLKNYANVCFFIVLVACVAVKGNDVWNDLMLKIVYEKKKNLHSGLYALGVSESSYVGSWIITGVVWNLSFLVLVVALFFFYGWVFAEHP
jgi:hypothetical protein